MPVSRAVSVEAANRGADFDGARSIATIAPIVCPRHAGEIERRSWDEENLVASGREVELLLSAVFEKSDDWLPRAAEVRDRVTDLLNLAPERRRAHRTNDHAGDACVDLGLAQRLDERTNRRRRFEELTDDAAGFHFLEVAANPQHERRIAGNLRLAADEKSHRDEPHCRNRDRKDDEHEHDPHASSECHVTPPGIEYIRVSTTCAAPFGGTRHGFISRSSRSDHTTTLTLCGACTPSSERCARRECAYTWTVRARLVTAVDMAE